MAHYLLMNPREEGEFVTEQRCACPTSQLYAIKFNEVKCKLLSSSNTICALFCYVLFFFIVCFASVAMTARGQGSMVFIIGAPISCFVAIIMTIICAILSEFTHTALEVLYKCRSCDHQVHVTYEVLPNACSWIGGEVFNSYGRYTRTCQQPKPLSLKTTAFEDIERAYRNMSPQYDQCCRNSVNWTRQMINRLR